MKDLNELKVHLYCDGAKKEDMLEMAKNPLVKGFTTNPSLMKQAGINDYTAFALEVVKAIPDRPLSFEVFADEPAEMKEQALKIKEWGDNVFVKIPVMNTKRKPTYQLIADLASQGVNLNITAIFNEDQVSHVTEALGQSKKGIVSVFAGRVADTGRDPMPLMERSLDIMKVNPNLELLWASCREVYNVFQANEVGCHIITVTPGIIKKLKNFHKDLEDYSHETVQAFYQDATAAGFSL